MRVCGVSPVAGSPLGAPAPKTARDRFWARRGMKQVLWIILPLSIGLGLLFPVFGFGVLICMGASVGVAFVRGRAWCDVCPRGTFFDVIMRPLTPERPVPAFLRTTWFRALVLAVLMGGMGVRLAMVWGDPVKMGAVFVSLLLVTTLVGIVLAVPFSARTWCAICPMGSMASWIGKRKAPLHVDAERCSDCSLCARACPMALNPAAHGRAGLMEEGDCISCLRCVAVCPKGALSFDTCAVCVKERKSA